MKSTYNYGFIWLYNIFDWFELGSFKVGFSVFHLLQIVSLFTSYHAAIQSNHEM